MTLDNFINWCRANGGVQSGSNCMISGKGVYTLVNSRIKQGDQWILEESDLF
jgi:hypothetical protein